MSVITPDIFDRMPDPDRQREEWKDLMDFGRWALEKYGCEIEPVPDTGEFSHIKITHNQAHELQADTPHHQAAKD